MRRVHLEALGHLEQPALQAVATKAVRPAVFLLVEVAQVELPEVVVIAADLLPAALSVAAEVAVTAAEVVQVVADHLVNLSIRENL